MNQIPGDRIVPWITSERNSYVPLKTMFRINPSVLDEDTPENYEFRYIDIGSVDSIGRVTASEPMTFADAPSRARRKIATGDVILSTVRTYLKAVAQITDAEATMICSTGFAVLRPSSGVFSRYAYYWLSSTQFVSSVVARSVGVSYPAINPDELGQLPFPNLPYEQQRAIADFLDRETEKIDELVRAKHRLIELNQELHLAHVEAFLTSGSHNPDRWPVLARFITSMCDGPFGSDMKSEHYADAGVRVIRLQNIRRGYFDNTDAAYITEERFAQLPGHDAKPGDLLVAGLGDPNNPVGRACVLPDKVVIGMVKADCFRLRLDENRLRHDFAACVLNSVYGRSEVLLQLRGATRDRINLSGIARIRVPQPDIDTQARIAEAAHSSYKSSKNVRTKIGRAVERLQEYRTTLISTAVSGEFDIHRYEKRMEALG